MTPEIATVTETHEPDTLSEMRVLLIAPYFDRNVPGESWVSYRWVEEISKRCNVTVLTTHSKHWDQAQSPLPNSEVVNWPHIKLRGRFERFDNEFKPHFLVFYMRARKWIKRALSAGRTFDVIHQVNPVSMRYPCPAQGLGIPYVLGPHCGSIPTPIGFRDECRETKWYRRLRDLDRIRLRRDPWLRSSFRGAAVVLGFAPYVRDTLADVALNRFELVSETGPTELATEPKTFSSPEQPLRLIFVGRIIRTKGVIDAIRAVARASKEVALTFEIIGAGDMLDACKAEAERLQISDIVTFAGRLPRPQVFERYKKADVCLFPSFREPSGNVIFEAMGFGLPMISSSVGGPGYLISPECGITVEPRDPAFFVRGLSDAIMMLARNRDVLPAMSRQAILRSDAIGSWKNRVEKVMEIYGQVRRRP